jgi:23S rRNA-/tRNA-specific pseudouridylate synthase
MKDTENDELQRRPRRRPGVIVKEDRDAGYIIVNKPPGVPVHATVGK